MTKIWKTTFRMEFFNEIWLKVGEHEYIYIFEIKFEKKVILFKNGNQNKFLFKNGDQNKFCEIVQ